jgi:hypothetical protein
MWLFWLFEFLGFVAVILLIVAYCRIRNQRFWSFTWKYLKWILLSIVGVWLVIAVLCGSYVPIDRTRALPGSSDHGNHDDVNDFYPTN